MDQSADKLPLTIHLKRVIFSVASPCERNTIQLKKHDANNKAMVR